MKKTIKINGTDRTDITAGLGYSVSYVKVHGNNGGTMIDGSETEDVLAVKAVVSVPLLPTTIEEAEEIIADVYSDTYAEVYFYDLLTGNYKTSSCIYEDISAVPLLSSIDGNDYWYCGTLNFTERG